MRSILALPVFLAALVVPALAGPGEDAALAPFRAFVANINANNISAAVGECAPDSSATDEIEPYHWTGNGCEGFANALSAVVKQSGQTDELMTLGEPVVVDVGSTSAYASIPGHLTFKTKNMQPATEDGMFM